MSKLLCIAILTTAGAIGTTPVSANESCDGFKWDVSKELALFATAPAKVAAATQSSSAPVLLLNHLYELRLASRDQVEFPTAPEKQSKANDTYGGMARFKVTATGRYWIALDGPLWVDVLANGQLVTSKAHQGHTDCTILHKIVEYELPAGADLTLQLSAATAATVRIVITAASPPRT